jgi:hypothetical protein
VPVGGLEAEAAVLLAAPVERPSAPFDAGMAELDAGPAMLEDGLGAGRAELDAAGAGLGDAGAGVEALVIEVTDVCPAPLEPGEPPVDA